MNGINVKNYGRCRGKNVIKDSDDENDEGFVSSFCTLEDTILSLPMACYYHRLNQLWSLEQQWQSAKLIRNRLLHPLPRGDDPDFD